MHQGDVSVSVKNVDLICLRKNITIRNMGDRTIETDGRKFLLDAPKLVDIDRRDRTPNYRDIFQLGPD
jgi:hypothetical protein